MLPLWKVKKIKYYKITYIIRSQITYQWMDKKWVLKFALIIMREISELRLIPYISRIDYA